MSYNTPMKEETKEEYIARHRLERGIAPPELHDPEEEKRNRRKKLRERFNSFLFLIGFVAFFYVILMIFGMMKGN